uniref:Uncharacterized protein n=1 Tax=Eucampia antarctica TaxID=49252 RepID=A0A7S2VZH7_9STRA|mmetsp:Transcript_13497/g.13078  ORF Transcript_13497/g.13078 Transcript_13497/m.13078 type:complete len:347 (+) Transcript_13497:103-1143(+)
MTIIVSRIEVFIIYFCWIPLFSLLLRHVRSMILEEDEIGKMKSVVPVIEEPNPPIWPDNVLLFRPDDEPKDILERIKVTEDEKYEYRDIDHNNEMKWGYNSNRHFTKDRYALLFAPGEYDGLDFEVGYYVQLSGLGVRADDVVFTAHSRGPFVEALNKREVVGGRPGLSLDTFWRIAENFKTEADEFLWAVSQAAPLRRVHVAKDLILHDAGAFASGGVLANAIVEGNVQFGSQQQYLSRNVNFLQKKKGIFLGAWSNVFVGCINNPNPSDGIIIAGGPSVTIDSSPQMVVEKPFVVLKEQILASDPTKFELHVPKPRIKNNKKENGNDSTTTTSTTATNSTIGPD